MWIATGLGIAADSFAVSDASYQYSLRMWLFWPALVIPNAVFAGVLLQSSMSRALRHGTVALVGIYSALIYHMSSPLLFSGFDEHLHERTLSDLLLGSGLFAPNPLLKVSPNYPGMELATGVFIRLTGVPLMLGAILVVLLCRYLLVLVLYQSALSLRNSPRFASIVVLFYATSPQFFFFNSQFAYQTMALPLGLGGLLLVRRSQMSTGATARRALALGVLALAATVVTHHITSWFVFAFLLAWTIFTRPGRREKVIKASAYMGIVLVLWTASAASKMVNYLGPVLADVGHQVDALISGASSRRLLGSQAGVALPEWQRVVLFAYAGAYTICAVVCGFILIKRWLRDRNRLLGLIGILTICYPVSLAAHFVQAAASLGDRASTFLFLPLALSLSLVITRDSRVISRGTTSKRPALDLSRPRIRTIFAIVIGVAYLGGTLLGSGPDWELLPGPYMVVADSRSQDPGTLAAVRWAKMHLPPGSRIVADRETADLFSGEARLWPLLAPTPGLDFGTLYFSPSWNSYQTQVVQQLHISYIYVDERWSEALPQEGYYIYYGETKTPQRLTVAELSKFSNVLGLLTVYRNGPISIYSTADLGETPKLTGFTGYRSMGFGTIGDAVFGVLVVALGFVLRRRLRWLGSAFRDADSIGRLVALTSSAVFVGLLFFGLRAMPGPSFTIGAAATGIVLCLVTRQSVGQLMRPRWLRYARVSPLAILGIALVAVGILIDLRAASNLDVVDVNNILALFR